MRTLLIIVAALLGLWIAFQIAAFVVGMVMVSDMQHQARDDLRRIEKEMRR